MKIERILKTDENAAVYLAGLEEAHHEYPEAFGFDEGFPAKRMHDLFFDREVTSLGIRQGERIVAGIGVCIPKPEIVAWGYGGQLVSSPGLGFLFRRQNVRSHGLGRQLLAEGLDMVAEHDLDKVYLEVVETNANARSLYKEAGFKECFVRDFEAPVVIGMGIFELTNIKRAATKLKNQL